MSDAPERVWLAHNGGLPSGNYPQEMKKGYVLEDLYTALQARLAKVEAEVQQINAGWERTSLMLSSALLRAEAAEARVKELVEALDNLLEAITASDQIGDRRLTITGPTANLRRLLDACVDARATLAAMEKEKADE